MSRNRDFSKFKRGQVWWLHESTEDTLKKMNSSHVLAKSRPWLIVSCDDNNDKARILNVVPISQSSNPNFISHVSYVVGHENVNQVIECEQITTKDMREFFERGKYMYTLSDSFMRKVTETLFRQLGGELQLPDLDSIISIIEKLAKERATQIETEKKLKTDFLVTELSTKLADIFNIELTTPAGISEEMEVKVSEVDAAEEIKSNSKLSQDMDKVSTNKSKKKKRWDEEAMLNYLIDYDSMTKEELIEKYNFAKKETCTQYASKFKRILGM